MDELDTGKLRAKLNGCSVLPWVYEDDDEGSSMGWIEASPRPPTPADHQGPTVFDVCGDSGEQAINAELAVAAVNALPTLLDTIDTLRKQLAEARAEALEEAATIADEHAPGGEYYERDHDEGSMRLAIAKTLRARALASDPHHKETNDAEVS